MLIAVGAIALGQGLSGRRAPSFALPDSSLKPYDILDYRGRWLVLDYMKTDMPASKPLSKQLDQLKTRLGAKVAILSDCSSCLRITQRREGNSSRKPRPSFRSCHSTPARRRMWYFKVTPQHPQFDSPHLFVIDPQGMIVRDWNQADIERGGYMPRVEALLTGGGSKK